MGGSSDTKQGSPTIPGWLKPLLGQTTADYSGFGSMDNFWNEYANMPTMGTAGIPQGGLNDIGTMQQWAQSPGGLNPEEQAAAGNYDQFLGQAGKPSEATQAELGLFQSQLAPQINQQSELMGQGNSGAALEAQATGMQQAMVPFEQQDLQNQLTASQGLGQLGQLGAENVQNAMGGQQWKQQTSQEADQNLYNMLMNREQLGTSVLGQPFGLLSQAIGGGSTVQTQPKF